MECSGRLPHVQMIGICQLSISRLYVFGCFPSPHLQRIPQRGSPSRLSREQLPRLSYLVCLFSCICIILLFFGEQLPRTSKGSLGWLTLGWLTLWCAQAQSKTSQSFSESLRVFPLHWLQGILSWRKSSERESRCAHWDSSALSAPPTGDMYNII